MAINISIFLILIIISHFFLQVFIKIDAKVTSIIVFGDSSVDSGNNNYLPTVLKSNFRPYGRDFYGGKPTGRFSNGRVPTDFISKAFGLKKTVPAYLDQAYTISDFVTGVCFASAGTGYDNLTSEVLNVMSLWKELELYKEYQRRIKDHLGTKKAQNILAQALYIISMGTNDFLENYYLLPNRRLHYRIEEYQNFLIGIAKTFINQIYTLGARKISLTGLPPMGCLPLERTTNLIFGGYCTQSYNNVALDFNKKLQALVSALNKELFGIHIVFSNPYDILYKMIQHPESFGFENAARACCGTGYYEMSYLCRRNNLFTCKDANKYVFWDSFHPTEKTNAVVANYTVQTTLSVFK